MAWFGGGGDRKTSPLNKAVAPGPVAPATLLGGLTPPSASEGRSNATAEALLAAKRARKRAGAGATAGVAGQTGAAPNPAGVTLPKGLIGY